VLAASGIRSGSRYWTASHRRRPPTAGVSALTDVGESAIAMESASNGSGYPAGLQPPSPDPSRSTPPRFTRSRPRRSPVPGRADHLAGRRHGSEAAARHPGRARAYATVAIVALTVDRGTADCWGRTATRRSTTRLAEPGNAKGPTPSRSPSIGLRGFVSCSRTAQAVVTAGSYVDEGMIAGTRARRPRNRPTGDPAQSDRLAAGVIRAAGELGSRCRGTSGGRLRRHRPGPDHPARPDHRWCSRLRERAGGCRSRSPGPARWRPSGIVRSRVVFHLGATTGPPRRTDA